MDEPLIFAEVAAVGDLSFFVLFGKDCFDQAEDGGVVEEDADHGGPYS